MWSFCRNHEPEEIRTDKTYLHVADNQCLGKTKMAKIKPRYNLLNEKMIQFGVLNEDLSIDESMFPYFGRHSCKQYVRGKPIRFKYKLWTICSSTEMLYKTVIFEGKTDDAEGSLGTRVVLNLLTVCEYPCRHHVYMDNFFCSHDLFIKLKQLNFRATGTVWENRLNGCTITNTKAMKRKRQL